MTVPRHIVVAMPSAAEADCVEARVARYELADHLGAGRVKRANWHQSLSDQYFLGDLPDLERKLVSACSAISACAVSLKLNRVVREPGYCALYADATPAFRALLRAVKAALATQGIASRATNRPHITLSYWGAVAGSELAIEPVDWKINRVLVVKGWGDGAGYHYDVIAFKDLHAQPEAEQLGLFERDDA